MLVVDLFLVLVKEHKVVQEECGVFGAFCSTSLFDLTPHLVQPSLWAHNETLCCPVTRQRWSCNMKPDERHFPYLKHFGVTDLGCIVEHVFTVSVSHVQLHTNQ